MTKLESLVEALEADAYPEEFREGLIVLYFNKQDSDTFEYDGELFLVYDQEEQNEILEENAGNLFDDKLYELEELLRVNDLQLGYNLSDCINENTAVKQIIRGLSFEEEQDLDLLLETAAHYVYRQP